MWGNGSCCGEGWAINIEDCKKKTTMTQHVPKRKILLLFKSLLIHNVMQYDMIATAFQCKV